MPAVGQGKNLHLICPFHLIRSKFGVKGNLSEAASALGNMKALTAKQRRTAIGLFAALVLLVTFTLISGPFGYSSVCDRCGALRRTTNWQLPLTEFTVFSSSTEADTPLSRVLVTNSIVPPHTHHWLFGQGGGNGVRCAIGPGRHIRPAAESDEFAALVLALHQRGQIAFRDRVLRGVFDPDTSHLFRGLSFSSHADTMSAAEMQGWIAEQSEFLDETVTAYKKR